MPTVEEAALEQTPKTPGQIAVENAMANINAPLSPPLRPEELCAIVSKAGEATAIVSVPKPFRLTLDVGGALAPLRGKQVMVHAGNCELPAVLASHWWALAHGVRAFKQVPERNAAAEAAKLAADAAGVAKEAADALAAAELEAEAKAKAEVDAAAKSKKGA